MLEYRYPNPHYSVTDREMNTQVVPVEVRLDGKVVGQIREVEGGFAYFPKGQKKGGEVFGTVREVKHSLAG